jgi:hypothetical protein
LYVRVGHECVCLTFWMYVFSIWCDLEFLCVRLLLLMLFRCSHCTYFNILTL